MHRPERSPFRNTHTEPVLDGIQMMVGFASIVLNILLLVANHLRKATRWEVDGLLITATAVLDCVIGGYFVLGTAFRVVDPTIVHDSSPWCVVSFMMGRTASIAVLDMVALLALVRYMVIVHQHPPRRWFWSCLAVLLLGLCFVVALLRASTDVLHVFPSRMYCAPTHRDDAAHYKILVHLTVLLSFPPILIIPFCYIGITVAYVRQIYAMYNGEFPPYGRPLRRVVGMALIVLAYFAAILPEFVLLIAFRSYGKRPSPLFDGLAVTAFNTISIINALFPLLFHEEINPTNAGILDAIATMPPATKQSSMVLNEVLCSDHPPL